MTAEIQAAMIGAIATILTGAVAAGLVVWQIGQQARIGRDQARHSEGLQLRLSAYREMIATSEAATRALSKLQSSNSLMAISLNVAATSAQRGNPWLVPKERVPVLLDLQGDAVSKSIDFIIFIENWQFLVPRIYVFKAAFNSAQFDLSAANRKLFEALMKVLPIDRADGGGVLPWSPPTAAQLAAVEAGIDDVMAAVGDLQSYALDFGVEMQNALLGELFSHPLEKRRPIDPNLKVITLEAADELTRYFSEETPWARMCDQANADARARFGLA